MNTNSKKTKYILISILVVSIILALILWVYYKKIPSFHKNNQQSQQTSTNSAIDDTNKNNNSSFDTSDQLATNNTSQSGSAIPDKPILIKSSGNNGSVPKDIAIEFVCRGMSEINCKVVLQKQDSPNIELPNKILKDNRTGQFFSSWEWQSIAGYWQVYAVATNSQGKSAQSDIQTLEVK